MDIDSAKAKFDELRAEWQGRECEIETEEDARFQVVNRILTEVLGWAFDSVKNEFHTEGANYVDYLAEVSSGSRLVIEAKRTSVKLIDTSEARQRWYKVGGPALASAADGIRQAKNYCTDTASMFAALTNGFQWIGFWALRTDNKPPTNGHAAVFPNLDAISEKFALFFDLFSPNGIQDRLYQVHVHEAEGLQVRHGDRLEASIVATSIHLLPKSALAVDLERIYSRYFSSIGGDDDREMLAKCFVESRESREADHSLKKIARDLVSIVDVVESDASLLQKEIRGSVESGHGEFVLIVGNKGAGKSTFIDRFFRIVLDSSLKKKCVVLKVDLAGSQGDEKSVLPWLTSALLQAAETTLFQTDSPTYEQLQGVFIKEYDRWRRGEHKYLYEHDHGKFKERFGEWMYECRTTNAEKYLACLLKSSIEQRKLMPCLVFDNTDHFPQSFQETVFQYAQSLYRSVFSFVICPITDRTIWRLSKQGPLQSYNSRTFYLPVPSTKEVIEKRVAFLKEKLREKRESKHYFLKQGIRLNIENIDAFAASVEEVFLNQDFIARIIGWLSNHDIRRSLKIAERIITSPTLRVDNLLKAHIGGKSVPPRSREIKLALIRGNYNHFSGNESDFVANLFEVEENSITSPLLRLSILRFLLDRDFSESDPRSSYSSVRDIINYFEPTGVSPKVLREHLAVLVEYQLVQSYDVSVIEIVDEACFRLSPSGRIHFEFAFDAQEGSYVSEMALTTRLRNAGIVSEIRFKLGSGKMVLHDWQKIQSTFIAYCLSEDDIHMVIPGSGTYDGQRTMRNELRRVWKVGTNVSHQKTL